MRNSTVSFISKLIAAIPGAAFFGKSQSTKQVFGKKELAQISRQENLNRIFMVRHRIQHL
ncbi:hypothetical protein [Pollutibacter soli]|uniref:hypothetical protein n=1 Tax=Pollutibacter soli TaxID=3034157 RepID=UPI00301335FC